MLQGARSLEPQNPPPPQTTHSGSTGSTDPVTAYARLVVDGDIVAGPHVRAACRRHLNDLITGHLRGLRFDLERMDHALGFFPDVLRLNGGQFEGMPFHPHISQKFIIGSLFGWLREDGTRRFRIAYIEQGKGNGKSPMVAGIGLYCMVADGEPRAEIYAAATKKDQAMILFRDAVAMVNQSPALDARLKKAGKDDKVWNLFDAKTNSFFRPISADQGQSGPRPHCGLVDELHEHKSPTVMNMLSAGRKWRRQPLILAITNSGTNRKTVCWEYREKGTKIAAGIEEDDTFFAYICAMDDERWISANDPEAAIASMNRACTCGKQHHGVPATWSNVKSLWRTHREGVGDEIGCPVRRSKARDDGYEVYYPKDDPFEDESCWIKANPTLGDIIQPQYLRDEVNTARGMPSVESSVKRLNFCMWMEAVSPAIDYERWVNAGAEYELSKFRGMTCTLGIDLSATTDLTALVLDFQIDRVHWLWPMFWIPKEGLAERVKKDSVPYDIWVEKGFVYTTPGFAIDKDFIVKKVGDILGRYDITVVSAPYDRSRIDVLKAACDRQGVTWPLSPFGQGFFSMGPAWDTFETALLENRMRHPRNPCFSANAASAVVAIDPAGNKKPDKSVATGRIDGIVASVMAVGVADTTVVNTSGPSIKWYN